MYRGYSYVCLLVCVICEQKSEGFQATMNYKSRFCLYYFIFTPSYLKCKVKTNKKPKTNSSSTRFKSFCFLPEKDVEIRAQAS